jgi:hypothetical protein
VSLTIVSCDQTVLDLNIRFEAKDAPFIRTSGRKTAYKNGTIFPQFWREMGWDMEKYEKHAKV